METVKIIITIRDERRFWFQDDEQADNSMNAKCLLKFRERLIDRTDGWKAGCLLVLIGQYINNVWRNRLCLDYT